MLILFDYIEQMFLSKSNFDCPLRRPFIGITTKTKISMTILLEVIFAQTLQTDESHFGSLGA